MATHYAESEMMTSCLICETENPADSLVCGQCSAPMSIVQDVIAQRRDPRIITVIGESNAGKTVYLGFLLDMLVQRAGDFEAIPKGAYSINLQHSVISHMSRRMFPPKTPMEADQWHWAYYQVRRRREESPWVDLIMPDIAGESLAAEVATPKTFRVINNLMTKSAGLLMLVDAALAANGSSQPDFFAMKTLSYIDRLGGSRHGEKIDTPIAMLLCKSDHSPECFDQPREFVRANLNRVWNLVQSRFSNVEYFATSVVGSLGYATGQNSGNAAPVPLHTALRGVLEPFEWMIDQF